jgi:protein required for attachment to host cells
MKTPPKVWILVCDGGRSQVLAGEGRVSALAPVPGSLRTNDAPDPGADRHGERATGHASTGQGRYSVDEHGDPRRAIEARFLQQQLAWLEERTAEFDRLVIVAPPRALGEIRDRITPALKAKLAAEIAADLTKALIGDIARRVAESVPPEIR